ncbi:MAG: hypothetical protein A2042_06875 [Candidatus Schekmanbacteria bacterium GWA2_38_11]|uniref:UPF0251 protein A2042_06875 n=1 Tax=Candidatus Schekmanbacteria bacterium GWA2_38_11 TaxID=1817876 RepID=A0A1F7RGN3_9BACT|nr:MAG: hypothetical protein A2042_06875 [Candidatus Schekmanbacteria bacterium GWA2_38_11]
MPRPRKCRLVCSFPQSNYFKPRGIPLRELQHVILTIDEHEAIKLADLEGMEQEEAAREMNISRQTFGRILINAHKKIGDAIVNGKALKIEGGDFIMVNRKFECFGCGKTWEEPFGTGRPRECPSCRGENFHRTDPNKGYGRRGGKKMGPCGRGRNSEKTVPNK